MLYVQTNQFPTLKLQITYNHKICRKSNISPETIPQPQIIFCHKLKQIDFSPQTTQHPLLGFSIQETNGPHKKQYKHPKRIQIDTNKRKNVFLEVGPLRHSFPFLYGTFLSIKLPRFSFDIFGSDMLLLSLYFDYKVFKVISTFVSICVPNRKFSLVLFHFWIQTLRYRENF